MNSAPSKMKRAATETSEEIRNSAECTAFRAMTVSSPARMAAIENIQKKTDSQPERIMNFDLGHQKLFIIYHLRFVICHHQQRVAGSAQLANSMTNEKCQMTNGK